MENECRPRRIRRTNGSLGGSAQSSPERRPVCTWWLVRRQLQSTVLLLHGVRGEKARRQVALALYRVPGVEDVRVNSFLSRVGVVHERTCSPCSLVRAIVACGFESELVEATTKPRPAAIRTKRRRLPPRAGGAEKVETIMTKEPICAESSMSIRQLARLLEAHDVSGVPVVDSRGRMVGVVSNSDLIRKCSQGTRDVPPGYLFEVIYEQDPLEDDVLPELAICVQDFMSAEFATAYRDTPIATVANKMHERHTHRVVIIDEENTPIGIVTSLDVLGAFPTG